MNAKDRKELADVFNEILTAHMVHLERQIAEGFVTAMECMIGDLAQVFEGRTEDMKRLMAKKAEEQRVKGFSK